MGAAHFARAPARARPILRGRPTAQGAVRAISGSCAGHFGPCVANKYVNFRFLQHRALNCPNQVKIKPYACSRCIPSFTSKNSATEQGNLLQILYYSARRDNSERIIQRNGSDHPVRTSCVADYYYMEKKMQQNNGDPGLWTSNNRSTRRTPPLPSGPYVRPVMAAERRA